MRKFCAFVLSHGRADNVITIDTLKRQGYTGDIVVVIDDEDDQRGAYEKNFENVEVFCKSDIARTFDEMCINPDRRTVVYARNACFDIAKQLGYTHFVELDDDYQDFQYRQVARGRLITESFRDLDSVFDVMCDWLDECGAMSVAFAQGGDFIGGKNSANFRHRCLRKAMNSFFCRTDRPFKFLGRINEDVNTYTLLGSRGGLFLTVCDAMLVQKQTQKQAGGMSDTYLDDGTYVKSFTTVMAMPSAVRVSMMGKHKRVHHKIMWNNCVPKILSESWKK